MTVIKRGSHARATLKRRCGRPKKTTSKSEDRYGVEIENRMPETCYVIVVERIGLGGLTPRMVGRPHDDVTSAVRAAILSLDADEIVRVERWHVDRSKSVVLQQHVFAVIRRTPRAVLIDRL